MTWTFKRKLLAIVLVITLVIAGFGLGVLPINLFLLKDTIAETARDQLGVEIDIEGPLILRLGLNPTLSARAIRLGVSGQPLAQISSLKVKSRIGSILKGEADLRSLTANGISLEQDTVGEIGILLKDLDLNVSAPLGHPLTAEVSGLLGKNEVTLSVTGAILVTLLGDPESYPLEVQYLTPFSGLRLDGMARRPLSGASLQAHLEFESVNLAEELAVSGMDTPELTVLTFSSGLFLDGKEVRIENGRGKLNGMPFEISGQARSFDSRPDFGADIELPELDFAVFTGRPAEPSGNESPWTTDLLPLFNALASFDARVALRVGRLLNVPLGMEAEHLSIEAGLDDGILSVSQAGMVLEGAEISGEARLDSTAGCPILESRWEASGLHAGMIEPFIDDDPEFGGTLESLHIITRSCGGVPESHFTSLQTQIVLAGLTLRDDEESTPLRLRSLEARINWNESGGISFDGELLDEPIAADIRFGSVEAITSGAMSALSVAARGEAFQANLEGEAAFSESGLDLDVHLSGDVPRMGELHEWLGIVPGNTLPFRGQTRLRLGDAGLRIDGLQASLGSSSLAGALSWAGPEGSQVAVADFHAKRLDLPEIDSLFPELNEGKVMEEPELFELLHQNEIIEQWLSFPSMDLDLSIEKLHGIEADADDAVLHARLRDRLVDKGRLSFRLEGIEVDGRLDADLREFPWSLDFETLLKNVDLGRLLEALDIAEDLDAHADSVRISLLSEGNSIRQLAVKSHVNSRIESLHWGFEAGPSDRRFDIDLSELEVSASPGKQTLWRTSGTLNGSPVRARMHTPSLSETFDPEESLPIMLLMSTGDGAMMFDMNFDHVSKDELRGDFTVSGLYSAPEDSSFARLESPLGDYQLSTRLDIVKNDYLASDIRIHIGDSRASGVFNARRDGAGYHFDLDLDSPFLETDDLVELAQDFREAREALSSDPGELSREARETDNVGLLVLVDRFIDEFTAYNRIGASASIEELRSSGNLLGKAEMKLEVDGEEFILEPLNISLPGGNVDISYSSRAADESWLYALDLDIERLEYGGLLLLLDPESKAQGEMYLDIDLTSRAAGPQEVVNHLAGHIDLAVFPEDIEADFLDLWASNLVFALLPSGGDSGKKLNCMVGRFEVENGVMDSKNTFLDSTEIIVRARGDIDLAGRKLDLLVAPQAKREKFLSVSTPLAVTGSFDDFQVNVAPGGFLNTMFRWYYGLVYVPWKWLTGERFPEDGIATCYRAMEWEVPDG
jgi:hypothetical protein